MKRLMAICMLLGSLFLSGCKDETHTNRVYVFYQNGCMHCEHAHDYISRYYKNYDIKELDIHEGENMGYMIRYARKFKVREAMLGTPFIVMGDNYIMGWGNDQVKDFNRYIRNFKPKS